MLWGAAWAAVLASGAALLLRPDAWALTLVPFLGAVIAGGQLAGAFALVRGRAPAWVLVAAFALTFARGLSGGALPAPLDAWVGMALEPAGSIAAAAVLAQGWRRRRDSLPLALVPLLLLALALLDGLSARARMDGGALPDALLVGWLALSVVGIPLQLQAAGEGRLERHRRRAAARLRESQERFRALTENAFDLVAELDGDERLTYVNPRYEEVLGHPKEALLGHVPREFLHPDDVAAAAAFAQEAAQRGTASGLVLRVRHRDGRWVWLEHAARSFVTPAGERRWVMNSRDVTRRRAVEQTRERARERLEQTVTARTGELQASEARFRALADHAPELISEFDESGRYLFANAAFRELLGREPSALIGTSPETLIHPEDLPASRRSMTRAVMRESASRAVHRLRHADGSWRWFDNTGRAYRTWRGELRFVSIGRDVTEARRAEAERRRLEAHMGEVQRLESLGVLAGGIAHDFNNLLAVIQGNVALLERADRPEDAERLRRVRAAARHAQGLTEQMLTYAGRSVSKLSPLDLSQLVDETRELLGAAVPPNVRLELELGDELPAVDGDATQLRQVLLNLVTNAAEALAARGGTIRARTMLRRADPAWLDDAFGTAEPHEGPWVELEVRDDGPGMDESLRLRIFEPFYSTKQSGRGLGLAAVLGIARAHRGLIVLESAPGRGTAFHVLLPPGRGRRRRARPSAAAVPPPSGGARVLVVDDEDPVREVAQAFLERAGFRVVAARGGREALERLEADPDVDAVLLDLAMPDLSGAETLRRIRALRPRMPVVIASGYGRDLATERIGAGPRYGFVGKPYEPDALVAALREALEEGEAGADATSNPPGPPGSGP